MQAVNNLSSSTVLGGIPVGLREPLLESYQSIVKNFREGRWEPAELNGGKLSEVVYTILRGFVDGKFPNKPQKPKRMDLACKDLENADATKYSRSIRVHIPRVLLALYEVRNNRGVGHVGGDVNPNYMDSVFVLSASKWIMAELVREFHNVDTKTATDVVDALTARTLPLIWEVGGIKRVLNPNLSMKDKTLALLYTCVSPIAEKDLFVWVEHSNLAVYRRDVLLAAHRAKLLEYDANRKTLQISPTGGRYVEENVPLDL